MGRKFQITLNYQITIEQNMKRLSYLESISLRFQPLD